MAWNLDVDKVLVSWKLEPVPLNTNARLLEDVRATKRLLNKTIPNIDARLVDDPELLDDLNRVASLAIQRYWYQDPRGITSQSDGVGPFANSISIDGDNNGLYLRDNEINFLLPDLTDQIPGFATIKFGKVNANFNIKRNKSANDYLPIGENSIARYGQYYPWFFDQQVTLYPELGELL